MENITDNKTNSCYYIFVNGVEKMYMFASDGKYLEDNNADEAMIFNDIIDVVTYVEKRGLQRLATIRKVKS